MVSSLHTFHNSYKHTVYNIVNMTNFKIANLPKDDGNEISEAHILFIYIINATEKVSFWMTVPKIVHHLVYTVVIH